MRRLILAAVASMALAGAGSLAGTRAEAMPLAPGLAGASGNQAETVALVCNPVWNGYAWVRTCYRTGPSYYGPRPYYGGYYGRRYYRPRYY